MPTPAVETVAVNPELGLAQGKVALTSGRAAPVWTAVTVRPAGPVA